MPYSQRFVASVIVNGEVQKERPDGSVIIPFGCEYALQFRNKHKERRAVVKLFIDGEEQSKGGYVIPPSTAKIIERNSHSPKKFKFVAPDSALAQSHGKDENNTEGYNGVIECRFYLEKERPKEVHHHHHHHYPRPRVWPAPYEYHSMGHCGSVTTDNECAGPDGLESLGPSPATTMGGQHVNCCAPASTSGIGGSSCGESSRSQPIRKRAMAAPQVVAGVTVEGSHSYQTFQKVEIDLEDDFVPLKILLKGYGEGDNKVSTDSYVVEAESKKA